MNLTMFKLPAVEDKYIIDSTSIVKKMKLKEILKSKVAFKTSDLCNLVV